MPKPLRYLQATNNAGTGAYTDSSGLLLVRQQACKPEMKWMKYPQLATTRLDCSSSAGGCGVHAEAMLGCEENRLWAQEWFPCLHDAFGQGLPLQCAAAQHLLEPRCLPLSSDVLACLCLRFSVPRHGIGIFANSASIEKNQQLVSMGNKYFVLKKSIVLLRTGEQDDFF